MKFFFQLALFCLFCAAYFPAHAVTVHPYTGWYILWYGWLVVFGFGLLGIALFFYRKGFKTQLTYLIYRDFWEIAAYVLSLVTSYIWLYVFQVPSHGIEHQFVALAFGCPLILLMITILPAEIYRYLERKKSAGK